MSDKLYEELEDEEWETIEETADQLPVEAQSTELEAKSKSLGLPSFWGAEEKWFEGVSKARLATQTKHGLSASIPIICRGKYCPYSKACFVDDDARIEGARCPIEVATIIELYERYCMQVEIDPENVNPKKDMVDISLINELIGLDVKLIRAQNKLAIDADFVQQVASGSSPQGDIFYRPELHQAEIFSEKLRKDRHKIFDMLLGTRKSKKMAGVSKDPSSQASGLMAQARKMVEEGVLDRGMISFAFEGSGKQTPEPIDDDDDDDFIDIQE